MEKIDSELYSSDLSLYRIESILSKLALLEPHIDFNLREASENQLKQLVGKINRNDIREQDLKSETRRDYKKAVRKVYKILGESEKVDFMSTSSAKSEREYVDASDLPSYDTVRKLRKELNNCRDRAFITLLYETGMRPCEILNLKWKHFEDGSFHSKVQVHRSKTFSRTIPFSRAQKFLDRWREMSISSDSESMVWTDLETGQKVGYHTMYRTVQRASSGAEINSRTNLKAFRKSRATFLASKGFNAYQLMKFFGWDKPETALYYVRLAKNDVLDAYRQKLLGDSQRGGMYGLDQSQKNRATGIRAS